MRYISLLLISLILLLPASVRAQSGITTVLNPLDITAFPIVEVYLDIRNAQGEFIHNLRAKDIVVYEDENPILVEEIQEVRPGVQFVAAINPGPALGLRNNKGISRYDIIKQTLRDWAKKRQGSTLDDLSLLIPNGPEISHTSNPAQWLATLDSDQTNPRTASPTLDILFRAISLASDATPRPGMSRAILFITPPPEAQSSQALENLISQAKQLKIIVFAWMVSSAGVLPTQGVKNLMELTEQTGGKFFVYTNEETLPNLEDYLEPLRNAYRLVYQSRVTTSGDHQVLIEVKTQDGMIKSNPQNYVIDIQPPVPAFVSPPIQIVRKASPPAPEQGQEISNSSYLPTEYPLQVVFDFPDGRRRPLAQTALFVDGIMVAENLTPPFDQFIWKLDTYTSSGSHKLRVQAKDSLGLMGSSVEIPVQVIVERKAETPWAVIQQKIPLLSVWVAIIAGAVLILILVIGGRLNPTKLKASVKRYHKIDPVTQPVTIEEEVAPYNLSSQPNPFYWPQSHLAPQANAFLCRISEGDNLMAVPPIPIISDEVSFGRDPHQAMVVLDDPSVEALHARLLRNKDGTYRLADEGSIGGTWVNYTPVSTSGTSLEHGDLVHFGRVGFRFTIRNPIRVRKPVITFDSGVEKSPQEPTA